MRIPIVQGRAITEDDRADGPKVVVVNETMAKRFWPKGDAIGKRFKFFGATEPWAEIVGIARDAKYNFLGEDPQSYIYEAHSQRYSGAQTLVVRTAGNPTALLLPVERELKTLDREVPLTALETVEKTINDGLWAPRAGASLLGLFGLLALVLAAVGIYSVMSYSVTQRQREIGIRMALGARRSDVLRMMLGRGMAVVGVGLAVGLGISFALARLARTLLVGVSPFDTASFAGAAAVLAAVAVVANFVPTRRAAGVDPTVALRS
jgi:putative ABC transport system permease protein